MFSKPVGLHQINHKFIMMLWQTIVAAGIVTLIAISVATYIAPAASEANPSGLLPDDIDPADVAWTMTATSLQLLLTPGRVNTLARHGNAGRTCYSYTKLAFISIYLLTSQYWYIILPCQIPEESYRYQYIWSFVSVLNVLLMDALDWKQPVWPSLIKLCNNCCSATAFFYGGLGLHKNIVSTILQCVMTLIIITPLFMCIGWVMWWEFIILLIDGLLKLYQPESDNQSIWWLFCLHPCKRSNK